MKKQVEKLHLNKETLGQLPSPQLKFAGAKTQTPTATPGTSLPPPASVC
jgi:hypothetical protein